MQSFVGWNAAYIRLITKHLQQALAFIFVTIVYPNIDKHVSIKRQQQTFYIHLITFVFVLFFLVILRKMNQTFNSRWIHTIINNWEKWVLFFPSQIIDEFWGWWGYLFLTISNAKLKMDLWWKRKLNKLTWYSQWLCNIERPLNNSMNSLTRVASKKKIICDIIKKYHSIFCKFKREIFSHHQPFLKKIDIYLVYHFGISCTCFTMTKIKILKFSIK